MSIQSRTFFYNYSKSPALPLANLHDRATLIDGMSWSGSSRWREQRLRESNRNSEIRTAESFQDRIGDADDFSMMIEEGPAGTSRGSLRVEDDFVGQDISDVALRNDRMNEIAARQFRQDLRDVAAAVSQYLLSVASSVRARMPASPVA